MSESNADRYRQALMRGTWFNVLGTIAKLAQPLYMLSVTWLWGPAIMGLYLLGLSLVEIASGGIAAGYTDATTIFGSRHAEGAEQDPQERHALYRVLANTFVCTAVLSLLIALLGFVAARPLIEHVFPEYGELLPGLYLLGCSLVPRAVSMVAIAGTKAMMHMEHDALLSGVVHPLCMLGGFLTSYALGGGLAGLFGVQLVVELLLCVLSLRAFSRYFSLRELLGTVRHFEFDRRLLDFAVPQSFNLTFNRYIARVDSIMLASFGLGQADLGYFGTAALLTSNLSQLRLVFSGALGPVLARHHMRGEREAFQKLLSQVAGWTTSLVVPAILLCVVLRRDVLQLISHAYGEHSLFVAVLLIPPFTNCAYGMAGACLMFTGHTRVTLANSFCVAALNTLFTYLLIPRYGMLGAAVATALATSIISVLQMVELWKIEGVSIALRSVWKPHAGLLVGLVIMALVGDPVDLAPAQRMSTALGLLLGYLVLMLMLGHEELTAWLRRRSPVGSR